MKKSLLVRVGVIALGLGTLNASSAQADAKNADKWAASQLKRLSLRDKIGQMIMPWMEGQFKNFSGPEFQRLETAVKRDKVGGFIVYRGTADSIPQLVNRLQQDSDLPLLISADYEFGLPQQSGTSGTAFPSNMGIGATGDPKLARAAGKIIGLESRAVGVNWVFSPVADVNNNPDNPIINTRSFGEDPAQVGAFATQLALGLQEGGVMASVKHFPGHGDTAKDTHMDVASIPSDLARLESLEFIPFKAAIQGGVASVMVAHVTAPAVSGDNIPASLNPKLNRALLRDKLGFKGVVVTDAMDMEALVKTFTEEKAAVMAVEAGNDVLLMPLTTLKAIDAIEAAVRSGRITEARINESATRILAAKHGLGLAKQRLVDVSRTNMAIQSPENTQIANAISDRAITLLRNQDGVFPLSIGRSGAGADTVFIQLSGDIMGPELPNQGSIIYRGRDSDLADIDAPSRFRMEVWNRVSDADLRGKIQFVQLDPRSGAADYERAIQAAGGAGKVVLATFVRRSAGKGSVSLKPEQAAFVDKLLAQSPATAIMAFGSPYQIRQFPQARNYSVTYGTQKMSVVSGVRALLGEAPFTGKLPVSIPELFPIGSGISTGGPGPLL